MSRYFLAWFGFGLITCHALQCVAEEPAEKQSLGTRLAERGPIYVGDEYRCTDMVRAVNELRKVGKDEALRALKEFADKTANGDFKPRRDALFLICRCLFENPGGWPPFVGAPTLDIEATTNAEKAALRKFPLYPLILSKGVPFMMSSGYYLGGQPANPYECIELCESLPMRKSDMPTEGFDPAAKALVSSPEFAELFVELFPNPDSRQAIAEMILSQARTAVER